MMIIDDKQLLNIKGGIKISATLINAIRQTFSYFTDLGRSIGSSVRRIQTKRYC